MKGHVMLLLSVFVVSLFCLAVPSMAGASEKDEIIGFWKEIAAIKERNQELFMRFGSPRFADVAENEKWLEKLETFLKEDLAAVQKILGNVEKYGKTPHEVNEKWREIVGADDPFQGTQDIDGLLRSLEQGLTSIETGRKTAAENLVDGAELQLNMMSGFAESARPAIFERNKVNLELAKRFDPGNMRATEWLGKIDEMAAKSAADAEKAMNDYVFPGHIEGFAGPGSADELAQAAMTYINSTCKSNEKAVAAVVREKDWYCFRRNIFGEPTIWALTFFVAIQLEEEAEKDITRVWSISLLTEERPGVEKAPPFKGAAFNQSWKMRKSKLPAK